MSTLSNGAELRVEALRQHVSIFDLFERMGLDEPPETHQMRCPFHVDTHPSARVYADQNKLYCFTCQKGWDVIAVAQDHWHLSFPQALDWLEQEFGVPGVAQGLVGAIRSRLATRVKPDLRMAAEAVEGRIRQSRERLGYLAYTKYLYALDLTLYELAEKRVTVAEAQARFAALTGAVGIVSSLEGSHGG